MPFDKLKYPKSWPTFSKYIRFERAGNKCEKCGVPNGFLKFVGADRTMIIDPEDASALHAAESWYLDTKHTVTKIVLTVAHLDHTEGPCRCYQQTGMKCVDEDHVLALCQKDHLAIDLPHHLARRQKTLAAQKDAARPLLMEAK